jgi:hypothetical protein
VGESTRLVYDVGVDDLQAMRLHYMRTSPFFRRRLRWMQAFFSLLGILAVIEGFVLLSISKGNGATLGWGVAAFAMAILAFVYVPVLHRRRLLRYWRLHDRAHPVVRALGRKSIWIDGGTMHVDSADAKSEIKIAGLPDPSETPTHAYVHLDGNVMYVIPKPKVVSGDVTTFLSEFRRNRAGGA